MEIIWIQFEIEPGVSYLKYYLKNFDEDDLKFQKEIKLEIDRNIVEQFYITGGFQLY